MKVIKIKIRTSYFYQIRHFKKNMVPVSTALGDPQWYHQWNDKNFIYLDKRGILNGIRLNSIIVQGNCEHCCPCENKDYQNCKWLQEYYQKLNELDFNLIIQALEDFSKLYKDYFNIQEEVIIVLIVYEAPKNKCSERDTLIKYFVEHGVECEELKYPIKENY